MGGQTSSSFVPSVIKTNAPLNNDDYAYKDLLLQRYGERIEKLSQQDRWPGEWGPQGRPVTGGRGLARVPNLRVCKHLCCWVWHTQGGKDELTSCRGTV